MQERVDRFRPLAGQSVVVKVWNVSEPSKPPLSRRPSGTQWLQAAFGPPRVDDVDSHGAAAVRRLPGTQRREPQSMGAGHHGQDPETEEN